MKQPNCMRWLAMGAAALLLGACAGNDEIANENTNNQEGDGTAIGYSIALKQDWYGEQPSTRAIMQTQQPRNIRMEGSDGSTAWLQETTRSGIDRPTEADESLSAAISEGSEPETRAVLVETQGAMSRFSSFAFKTDGTLYYNNVASSNCGQL